MTTTADFVQSPPRKEELVDADPVQVPNNYDDDGDGDGDGDDALSLCNLSFYCDAADCSFADDEASTSSSSSSSSSDHDDFFEFSSIGDSDCSSDLRSDDRRIVFCGKLISHRESPPSPPPPTPEKRSPLPIGRGSQKSASRRTRSPTVRRRKCRWYLMAFGLARFPTEMALSEMRTRQSRNVEKKGSCDGDKSGGKGLIGLLKALGLGHRRRADAFVKASLGRVARA